MKKILLLSCLLFSVVSIAQVSLEPIGFEPRGKKPVLKEKTTSNLDSTFVYTYDTLQLPIEDEFSTSKLQNHYAEPGDPNVTEALYHQLLDLSDTPLPGSTVYTSSVTKRYTTQTGNTTPTDLTPTSIKYNNLTSYPFAYSTVQAYPPYNIYDTLDFPNDPDTVFLSIPEYVQDSARIFTAHLSNPDAIWVDSSAYRNFTHAVNPWTLGVMTFDGLDASGYPYFFGSTASGYADFLTSKPIDLSGFVPNDSIYFSFLVQKEGFGDAPEASDSLVLEFYDDAESDWDRVWSTKGGAMADFKAGHIRISQAAYFTEGFRFRFKNYGGLSGMLDEFHLDYVKLRNGSGYQDTVFKDFAFVYPVGSMIETYTQVPWDHWVNDPTHMNSQTKITVRNGSNQDENQDDGTLTISHQGTPEGSFPLLGQALSNGDLNYTAFTVYESIHDFTGGYVFSTAPPAEEKTFDILAHATAQFANITVNDSAASVQYFGNEYAYDDGSAEAAFGATGAQARLAYRFDPYEADTLLGVKMHFVPSVNDVSDKLFLLTVWADDNGEPGAVLYEDEFFYPRTPVYEDDRGIFTEYYLNDTALSLPDAPFYVGWRQVDADRLNIGFDRNTDNADKTFYSLNGGITWFVSPISGSMMMRPIFSTSGNADLGIVEPAKEAAWSVYPNPASTLLNLKWENELPYNGAIIRSVNGQTIAELDKNTLQYNVEALPKGMYFIQCVGYPSIVKVIH